jgi:hypothetical protein
LNAIKFLKKRLIVRKEYSIKYLSHYGMYTEDVMCCLVGAVLGGYGKWWDDE